MKTKSVETIVAERIVDIVPCEPESRSGKIVRVWLRNPGSILVVCDKAPRIMGVWANAPTLQWFIDAYGN